MTGREPPPRKGSELKKGLATNSDANGAGRAAILLIAMGTARASQVFRHLNPEHVGRVSAAISQMPAVSNDQMDEVLDEAEAMLAARRSLRAGGVDYARAALQQAFGKPQAETILQSLAESIQERPFAFVRNLDAAQVASVLAQERSQTVAMILAYLSPEQAAEVLQHLEPQRRVDVTWRMAHLGQDRHHIHPEAVAVAADSLNERTATMMHKEAQQVGGIDSLAAVLTRMRRSNEQGVLEGLRERDADLATEIEKRLFTFDDLAQLDNETMEAVFLEIKLDNEDLPLALKTASRDVKAAIFAALSENARTTISESIDFMGRRHIQEVEAAQQRILATVRKMEEEGKIHLGRGEADTYV